MYIFQELKKKKMIIYNFYNVNRERMGNIKMILNDHAMLFTNLV